MCSDALLLLFIFFLVSFFLTLRLGWQQQTPALVLAVQNELVYSAALSLSSRCVDCVWRAGKQSEQPFGDHCLPGSSARLPWAVSGTQGKLPWGACALGPAPHLRWTGAEEVSLTQQTKELGSCFWRARSIFQGISFSRGAVRFLGSLAWRFNPSWTYPPHAAEGIPLTF